ncbi:hypothetical protein GCM10010298_65800 [Streptomyces microflavus]|uniref:Uncharacterized protein n=1 Tax=Streptomyces microflavus TaxID=1919 RepID=A0A7J0CZ96_STRMI|nr:hypothetical protein Smic_63760 [Streptomyces microflavus]GGX91206.1 hypothetical protein GCM10010298_65800 [Streptomyces microflavus]
MAVDPVAASVLITATAATTAAGSLVLCLLRAIAVLPCRAGRRPDAARLGRTDEIPLKSGNRPWASGGSGPDGA